MQDMSYSTAMVDTQRYVALDLEYNQPSGTIIQVGGGHRQRFAKPARVCRASLEFKS